MMGSLRLFFNKNLHHIVIKKIYLFRVKDYIVSYLRTHLFINKKVSEWYNLAQEKVNKWNRQQHHIVKDSQLTDLCYNNNII